MSLATADLYDAHESSVQVVAPMFNDYGGIEQFSGPIVTVKVHEDNSLVRAALKEPGQGRVLVVDGGGSLRCALLGDNLAALGVKNAWRGIVVYGCIRDSEAIGKLAIGVKAMQTNPRKSVKKGQGERDVPVQFGGVSFHPGHYLYADRDGIILSAAALT
jgi:regulator of ribonuclease activity A